MSLRDRKSRAPFGLSVAKGLKNGFFNRSFVDFLLHDPISKTFLTWLKDSYIPDESFAQTLLRVFNANNGDLQQEFESIKKSRRIRQDRRDLEHYSRCGPGKKYAEEGKLCPRYSRWFFDDHNDKRCEGEFIRDICHLSIWDLPDVAKESRHFALVNKFDLNIDALYINQNTGME